MVDTVRVTRLLRGVTDSLASLQREQSHITADAMRRAVGFRNVLVHDYVAVDDDVVLARLSDLTDVDRFVSETAAWITGGTAS